MQESYPYYPGPEAGSSAELTAEDGALVVRLAGEFDRYAERLFLDCVRELLAEDHAEVRFDFSGVRFADTSGLRCLFQAQRQFRRARQALVLTGLPAGLERILLMVSSQSLARAVEDGDAELLSPALPFS